MQTTVTGQVYTYRKLSQGLFGGGQVVTFASKMLLTNHVVGLKLSLTWRNSPTSGVSASLADQGRDVDEKVG